MRIFAGELKKLFADRLILIFLTSAVFINGLIFSLNHGSYSAGASMGYKEYLDEIQTQAVAMENTAIFQKNMSEFGRRNIIKTARDFEKLYSIADEVRPAPSEGVEAAVNSPFTDIIVLLLILAVCHQLMIREKFDGSLFLMKSSTHGRFTFIASKTAAVICGSALISILLYGSNILLAGAEYGLGDTGRYIQSAGAFMNCGFAVNVRTFLIYYVLCKILIFAFFAVFMLIISYISKSALTVYLSLAAVDGVSAVLYFAIPPNHMLNFFKYINVFYFQQSRLLLGEYRNVNVFGHPVRSIWCFSALIAVIVILIAVNVFVFCKYRVSAGGKRTVNFSRRGRKITVNLQKHEFYKLTVTNMAALIIIIFSVIQIFMFFSHREHIFSEDINYRSFVNRVGGDVTEENQKRINAEYSRFDKLENVLRELSEQFDAGKIGNMEYAAKSFPITEELEKRSALEAVEERFLELLDLHRQTGKHYSLIFEKEYDLLTRNRRNDAVKAAELLIVLTACFSVFFTMESSSGMEKIIKTCVGGKRAVARRKIVCGLIITGVAFAVTYLPDVLLTWKNYGFENLDAPVHSLKQFSVIESDITIAGYLLLLFSLRFTGAVIAFVIINYISERVKRPLPTAVISSAVLILPLLMKLWKVNIFDAISLTPLLTGNMIFDSGNVFMVFLSTVYAALAAFLMFELINSGDRRNTHPRKMLINNYHR